MEVVTLVGRFITTISDFESTANGFFYTSSAFDSEFEVLSNSVMVQIINYSISNVFYIEPKYLINPQNGVALLKLYNPSNLESEYYEKIITYVGVNNQYVMITSGNVKRYEKVYYEDKD